MTTTTLPDDVLTTPTARDTLAAIAARHGLTARETLGPTSATWSGPGVELVLDFTPWTGATAHVHYLGDDRGRDEWAAEYTTGTPVALISTAVATARATASAP